MMKTRFSTISLILFVITVLAIAALAVRPTYEPSYDKAYEAWDTGDYISALRGFDALLRGPNADSYFERIALLTGELFEVRALAPDGRNLKFSPDGRVACYESGARPATIIHLLDGQNGFKPLAEVNGSSAVFSPLSNRIVFLRYKETPELEKLRKELASAEAAASPDFLVISVLRNHLSFLEFMTSEIVVRDIATGREKVLPDRAILKVDPTFSADGSGLYLVGAEESNSSSSDIYVLDMDTGFSFSTSARRSAATLFSPGSRRTWRRSRPSGPRARPFSGLSPPMSGL
jgi:hypothetical protein